MELEILKETNQWLAINKPSGLLVEQNPFEISVEEILKKKHKYIGIVHRLDRVTSGVLIIAKKKSALKELNKQFSDKLIEKTYLAWVENKPKKNKESLNHFLYKSHKYKKAYVSNTKDKDFVPVSLSYEFIKEDDNKFLLQIFPKTGKFHQIRAQLAHIDSAIVDDTKYNGSNTNDHLKSIALQASQLKFIDPMSKEAVTVSIPEEFRYKN